MSTPGVAGRDRRAPVHGDQLRPQNGPLQAFEAGAGAFGVPGRGAGATVLLTGTIFSFRVLCSRLARSCASLRTEPEKPFFWVRSPSALLDTRRPLTATRL